MKAFKIVLFFLSAMLILSCVPMSKPENVQKGSSLDQKINNLTSQIISSFNQSNVRKIAVIEFADLEGNITQLGRFIAEELITRIFTTGKFDVVERNLLQKVLDEQKLGTSGYIDQETAISIGQILGVDAIITGSLTDLGENVKINARLISTQTGSVFAVASVNVLKDSTIKLLMGESSEMVVSGSKATDQKPQHSGLKPPVVERGIQFVMKECFFTNGTISLIIDVTNLDRDKHISLLDRKDKSYLRIIDDLGREFKSREQFLGTHQKDWNGIQNVMLVQDVATQYTIKFPDVKTKPELVKRLDLLLEIPDIQNYFIITFRDIPVD